MVFIDLKTLLARVRDRLDERVAAVYDHGQYILGPEVAELEKVLADFVGVKHCVGVSSGTDSLLIALMASWASGRLTLDLCWSAPFAILCKSVGKPLSVTPVTIQCVVMLEPFAGRYDRVNSCQFFRIGSGSA